VIGKDYLRREAIISLIMITGGIAIMVILSAPAWACFAAGWFGIGWWVSVIPPVAHMIDQSRTNDQESRARDDATEKRERY